MRYNVVFGNFSRITSPFFVLLHPFAQVTPSLSYYFTLLSGVARKLEDSITRTTGHLASATDASTMSGTSQYIVAKVEYILENCAKYFLGFDICQEIILGFKGIYYFLLIASNYLHSQFSAALFLLGK